MLIGDEVAMVATTVSSQFLRTMAKAEGFHYDVCFTLNNVERIPFSFS